MLDEMPRNSESQMLSACVKWLKKNEPECKILFTWADGMLGKCGYVYQASNFIYTGYVGGEFYLKDGIKIHVRSMKQLLCKDYKNDKRLTVRPTLEQMQAFNIRHYKGKQFRYIYFLCDKKEQKRLIAECLEPLDLPRPKDNDLNWTVKNINTGKWEHCAKPQYVSDMTQNYINLIKKRGLEYKEPEPPKLENYKRKPLIYHMGLSAYYYECPYCKAQNKEQYSPEGTYCGVCGKYYDGVIEKKSKEFIECEKQLGSGGGAVYKDDKGKWHFSEKYK